MNKYWCLLIRKENRNKEEYQLRLQIVHVQLLNVFDFAVLAKNYSEIKPVTGKFLYGNYLE